MGHPSITWILIPKTLPTLSFLIPSPTSDLLSESLYQTFWNARCLGKNPRKSRIPLVNFPYILVLRENWFSPAGTVFPCSAVKWCWCPPTFLTSAGLEEGCPPCLLLPVLYHSSLFLEARCCVCGVIRLHHSLLLLAVTCLRTGCWWSEPSPSQGSPLSLQ